MIICSVKKMGGDEFGSVPVEKIVYTDKEGNSYSLNYSYLQPHRSINDGWVSDVRRHTEKDGVDIEKILLSIKTRVGYSMLRFESEILNLTYRIETKIPCGESIRSPRREHVVKLIKADGQGLEPYITALGLKNVKLFEINDESQTIYALLKSRQELVYSS